MNSRNNRATGISEDRTAEKLNEVGELIGQVARRWAGRRVEALNDYRQILADYGTGRTDNRTTAKAMARLTADEAIKYPGELLDLASDYATGLARLAGITATGTPGDTGPGTQRAVHDLMLTGDIGDTASADLVIENPRDVEVALGFAVTPFSNDMRVTKLTPAFEPANCIMAPGSEQKVTVSAKLDGRTLKAGETYTAQAIVDGFDDMVLRINLVVGPA
ncbi:hypothetical protein [Aurantiacibacter poecillastricola]|uniref:hypothetical protein n=1 Tax=Aurantiacibacter poecillastricola TaxID=3064385 RepID=UPI00273FB651|nr:hypothetical protein [Aurantiacibacter sp. 219JJ12-13]MDP5261560.1 hypothetical protein [Aurantiacibacter sp. 219JJ12-13]